MTRKRNKHSLARRRPRFEPRSRLLVVCEGKITEPRYLKAFVAELKARLIDVEIVPEAGVPKTLVEYAVGRKKDAQRAARRDRDTNQLYDEIWCVFDVDEHPNLREAAQQANAHGFKIAISNPCIELWGVLHFQDQFAHQERDRIAATLRQHLPRYIKEFPFATIWPLYEEAVDRAKRLDHWHSTRGTEGENPCTRFYQLTERIKELSKDVLIRKLE